MKIALYGGSFNPPHLGHVEAVRSVLAQLRPDKLLLIPANIPPHKDMAEGSPDAEERLVLCELAFGDLPGVELSDMEIRREGKSYTSDTLDILRAEHPDDEFFLVIGTDMFLSFRTWYNYQHILSACTLAVLSREDDDGQEIEQFKAELETEGARIVIVPHEPLPMSSTEIRERLRKGLGSDMLPEKVYSRIIQRRLYAAEPELTWLRERILEYLSPNRIAHTAGCESEAVMLSKHWGEDPEKAAVAGILHDMTKKLDHEKQLLLCEKYGIILDNAEKANPLLLHAKTGAEAAKELFGVSEDVSEAIRWHTTGKPDMTLLEKIIYLADVIEPNRDFPCVEELRALAYEDIDKAMARALELSLENIRKRNIEPYKDTVEAYLWYHGE